MIHSIGSIRILLSLALASLLALAAPLQAASPASPPASYRLGIFPYIAPRQIVEFFGPVAASMEAELQRAVKLESTPSFPDFTRALVAKSYDIALIQPFDFPDAVGKHGYIPLAQMAVPLVTQFFVRDDSRYRKIEDLHGTTIALPPAQSANARMAVRALYENKLIPGRDVEVRHFSSHDSCIQQVWTGIASACGTAERPILLFERRMQAKLRAIYDTPAIPPVLYVVHPRVPAEHRVRLQNLIIGWSQNDEGRALLNRLAVPGYIAARPADYAMMRNYDPAAAVAKAASAAGKHMALGVFPYLSGRQLAQHFAPAIEALGRVMGLPLHMRTAASYSNFQEAIASATHDIVFVQPFDYALAAEHGYLPLARMKDDVEGVFSVLDGSPYKQIADLKGKVVAMPPTEAALSRLGRHALAQAGLVAGRDVEIIYTKNQDACLQALQRGVAAACMISLRTLSVLPTDLTQGVRAIGQPRSVPGAVFMAHKRLGEEQQKKLQAEMIGWKDSAAGREILLSLKLGDLVPVDTAEYRRLSQLWDRN